MTNKTLYELQEKFHGTEVGPTISALVTQIIVLRVQQGRLLDKFFNVRSAEKTKAIVEKDLISVCKELEKELERSS